MACVLRFRVLNSLMPVLQSRLLCTKVSGVQAAGNTSICIQTSVERDMPVPTERGIAKKARRKPKRSIPIRSPIQYDYEYPMKKRSKIQIKLQDLEGRPAKKEEFIDYKKIQKILHEQQMDQWMKLDNGDMPVEGLPNPYAKAPEKCILCQYKVELDYKNTRLLSQFVSPFTGQIMGRHITGLCVYMQDRVRQLVQRAQTFGYMPSHLKNPDYLKDPKLFDPFKRKW